MVFISNHYVVKISFICGSVVLTLSIYIMYIELSIAELVMHTCLDMIFDINLLCWHIFDCSYTKYCIVTLWLLRFHLSDAHFQTACPDDLPRYLWRPMWSVIRKSLVPRSHMSVASLSYHARYSYRNHDFLCDKCFQVSINVLEKFLPQARNR